MKLSPQKNTVDLLQEPQPTSPSEEKLAERVRRFVNERVPGCEDLIVEDRGCCVILQGRVPSAHAKWLCLQCSRHVAGVIHVIDELQIDEAK